jgi:tRNA A37 methylthiotransferase MiaB
MDSEVLIQMECNYLRHGDFAEVRITEANEHDLRGEVV